MHERVGVHGACVVVWEAWQADEVGDAREPVCGGDEVFAVDLLLEEALEKLI